MSAHATDKEKASLVTGFLAAAEFADCGPDAEDGLQDAEWSDDARADARRAVEAWLSNLTQEQYAEAARKTVGHADFSFDVHAGMGTDIYYRKAGHGVNFSDRNEYPEDLATALNNAAEWTGISVYLGDDGLRYFA